MRGRIVVAGLLLALAPAAFAAEVITNPIPKPVEQGDVKASLELVAEGLNSVVWMATPGDGSGRLFLCDQPGIMRLVKDGKLVSQPVADLRSRVVEVRPGFDERGLLGLAFHPDFAKKGAPGEGKLYTYTSEPVDANVKSDFSLDMKVAPEAPPLPLDHQAVIAEWKLSSDGQTLDLASRREVMRIDQPQFNHDGGTIVFGPDKMLYIGLGDGGAANDTGPGHTDGTGNGQDLSKALGKILRVDPLAQSGKKSANGGYSVPTDNPFVNQKGALPEIWAYGLRNPWRMAFSGDQLIAGEVGQEHIEEVNIIQKGGNYGWRTMEGPFYFDPTAPKGQNIFRQPPAGQTAADSKMIGPVVMYDHDEGISIAGGYVYRGSAIPALKGQYVYGEWTDVEYTQKTNKDGSVVMQKKNLGVGRVFYSDLNSRTPMVHELVITGTPTQQAPGYITAVGEDEKGELYIMTNDKGGPIGEGSKVWKLVPAK